MMHCNYTSLMYQTYCQFLQWFLPVFPLYWQKYFLPWKTQPCIHSIFRFKSGLPQTADIFRILKYVYIITKKFHSASAFVFNQLITMSSGTQNDSCNDSYHSLHFANGHELNIRIYTDHTLTSDSNL